MKKINSIEFENEGLSCTVIDDIAVLKMSRNIFDYLLNIEHDTEMLEWFDLVEQSKARGILAISESECYGEKNYAKFLSEASGKDITPEHPAEITKFAKSDIRAIEINMLMNYIRKIVNFNKIFISGIQGEIVTPFIGLSLASDFRFVDESTVLLLTHSKYSLHPSGALPFFLPKYIGHGKAMEYLIKGGKITAEEALQLNIVNAVLPSQNFYEKCLDEAKQICKLSLQYVRATKHLSYNFKNELNKYFDLESNYMFS